MGKTEAKKKAKAQAEPAADAAPTPKNKAGAAAGLKSASVPQQDRKFGKRKGCPAWLLVLLLIVVVGGGILFMLNVGGWFQSTTVTLDPEYYAADATLTNTDGDFLELLSAERYEELIGAKKSFVVFVDQTNCQVANQMRGFIKDYVQEAGIKLYRMMFSEVKETALHEQVKYYPSVVIVLRGQPVRALDANAEADADKFNQYEAFKAWMDEIL